MTTLEDAFLVDIEDSDDDLEVEFRNRQLSANNAANNVTNNNNNDDSDSDDSLDDLIAERTGNDNNNSNNNSNSKKSKNKNKNENEIEKELFCDMEDLIDIDEIESKNEILMTATPVEAVSDLLNSDYLKQHIKIIEQKLESENQINKKSNSLEKKMNDNDNENSNENDNDNEMDSKNETNIKIDDYSMINSCNNLVVEIDENISKIDKFIKNIYSKKFPELEEMVTNPIEYAKCVKILSNKTPEEMSDASLNSVLMSKSEAMMVQISATTTNGKKLDSVDLSRVLHGCDVLFNLNLQKEKILNFITSRVHRIAPNVCELIGPNITSKLITMVGNITKLSNMAACNVQNVGSIKRNESSLNGGNSGFAIRMSNNINNDNITNLKPIGTEQSGLNPIGLTSGSAVNLNYYENTPHFGIISQCDLVKNCPMHLKVKALRQVSNKVVLCARIDATLPQSNNIIDSSDLTIDDKTKEAMQGEIGIKFRNDILNKMNKWQEPPAPKPRRPLAIPDNKPKKKRGGKRYRKMREKYKITEMQKLRERMAFGKAEQEFIDGNGEIVPLGMLSNADDVNNNMGKNNYRQLGMKLRTNVETGKKMSLNDSKLTKLNRKQIAKQRKLQLQRNKNTDSNIGSVTGLKTSLQFGSKTGIELSNPDLLLKKQSSNDSKNNKDFVPTNYFDF